MHDQPNVPHGFCHCGCGERTKIAKWDDARHRAIKGEPLRYVHLHHVRRLQADESPQPCECGCGRLAGVHRGRARRFIQGHSGNKGAERDLTAAWKVDPATGCWVWQRSKDRGGYGAVKGSTAHKLVYEMHKGPVPDGLTLDHLCRNRACVNPEHMEPVTNAENCRRGANAKITADTARAVKALLVEGLTAPQIVERLPVMSKGMVYSIKYGHSWRDV